jgi:opacity protein-like surface antigen
MKIEYKHMKTHNYVLTALGGVALFGLTLAQAQDFPDNLRAGQPYVSAGIGPAIQQDLYIRNLGRTFSFDPGVRADISGGFNLTDNLAAELQTGAIASQIRTGGTAAFGGNRAYLDQVPLLGNLIIRAPMEFGITPYVGVGAGGVVSDISVREFHHWDDDSDITFAYQAMAGVNVALTRHIDVGLGYRFLGTTAHTWFADDPNMYTPAGSTYTHAVLATFTLSF